MEIRRHEEQTRVFVRGAEALAVGAETLARVEERLRQDRAEQEAAHRLREDNLRRLWGNVKEEHPPVTLFFPPPGAKSLVISVVGENSRTPAK